MAVTYPSDRVELAARPSRGGRGWPRLFAVGTPVLAVLAVMVVCVVTAGYVYESNRRGAESLSDDLLDAIDSRITLQVAGYLAAAVQLAESARAIGADRGVFDGGQAAGAFMAARLERFAQIAGYSYADPEGNFLYVVRNELGGYDTKLVDHRSGRSQITWIRRGQDGEILETATDPADPFDPRTRSWYVGAVRQSRPFWTGAYLFYTLRRPGITYAIPHYAENKGLTAVSGVDIELSALSGFLKRLKIGTHGKALVIDAKGRVIAYPSDNWLADAAEGAPLPHLDELNDPILTRVFNRLRVEGFEPRTFDVGDERIILSNAMKLLTGRDWSVLIVVPESDFLGFVRSSSWVALALSGVVILLVAGLAAQAMWRGLLAERRDKLAGERRQALEARAQALADLAAASNLLDRSTIDGVREATERAVQLFGAKRVGVWYLTAAGRTLVCEDNFDRQVNAHTSGAELHRDEFPSLFAALQEPAAIDAPDAAKDGRTRELAALYLQPLGVEGVHIAPIHSGKQLLGMLKVEDPHRAEETAGLTEFCTALASLLALRYVGGSTPAALRAADPGEVAGQKIERALSRRQAALEHRLLHHSTSLAELSPGALERAAVAVIKLPEWLSLGLRTEAGTAARMDAVTDEIRRALARSGVDYAALLDDEIVLAAFSAGPQTVMADAAQAATTAVDIRDRLVDLTSGWGEGSEFRIALDVGSVMVSACEGAGRSLWGGAIAVARVLAATGRRRAITVSETAYTILSGMFLFRQRGTYFLPETGTMRTFVLVGAL